MSAYRLYMALGDTQSYRIGAACATCVEDMPQALPLFRCIAGTISLAKAR